MLEGLAILFVTDALLALTGIWLMRSRRFGDSPPLSAVVPATLAALLAHILAYASCQAVATFLGATGPDPASRMLLFLINLGSGAVPAGVFGYATVVAVAHTLSTQVCMPEAEPDPLSEDAFKRARSLARRGEFVEAFEEVHRIAAQFPESHLPLIETARLQEMAGRYEDAAETLRRTLREMSHIEDARHRATLLLAELFERRFNNPETAAYLRERLRSKSGPWAPGGNAAQRPAHWVEMEHARRLAGRGDISKAVAEFREAFRRDPDRPRPMFEAATLLEHADRHLEAADVLREIIRNSSAGTPAWAEAMYRLAHILEAHLEDPDASRHILREVVRDAPGTQPAALAREILEEERNNGL